MSKKKYKKPNYKYKKEDQVVEFGQHKGKTIGEALEKDPTYFVWAKNNVSKFKLSKDLEEKLQKHLKEHED